MAKIKKKIRTITVDADKCNGCRTCEVICSAFHATPKYSTINTARARIHVTTHRLKNIWLPIFAGDYTAAECNCRDKYVLGGKEYDECSFCRAACPSRDLFKEPDSGLPLKCDMCEGETTPLCVEWCLNDVLTYEEREEEVEELLEIGNLEMGLESLVDKFGLEKITSSLSRLSQRE
jgi:benzoyl-CoA reductase subunit BamC